jgi:predicted amidohydrolase YtcJ
VLVLRGHELAHDPVEEGAERAGLDRSVPLGITSFQDACVGAAGELGMPDSFGAYQMAADYGMLNSHVVGALWWDRARGLGQVDDLLARREQAGDGPFLGTTVKLMLDGVCETFTAAMSAPYLDHSGHPADYGGRLFIDPEELASAVRRLGAEGFQLHFHAIGDLAVSTALDALAAHPAAQRRAARHHVAHLQFITPGTWAGSPIWTWWPTSSRCGRAPRCRPRSS